MQKSLVLAAIIAAAALARCGHTAVPEEKAKVEPVVPPIPPAENANQTTPTSAVKNDAPAP